MKQYGFCLFSSFKNENTQTQQQIENFRIVLILFWKKKLKERKNSQLTNAIYGNYCF